VGTTRTVSYNAENSTLVFVLFNYSLSRNKQPLTCTAVAGCGFYSKHGLFSVRCELNVM